MIAIRHVELYKADKCWSEDSCEQLSLVKLPDPVPDQYTCAVVVLTGSTESWSDDRITLHRVDQRWVFWIEDQREEQDLQWEFTSLTTAVHALVNHLNESQRDWTSRFLSVPKETSSSEGSTDHADWSKWERALGWSYRRN